MLYVKAMLTIAFLLGSVGFFGWSVYQALPGPHPFPVEVTILQVERGYVVSPHEVIYAYRRKYRDI